MVETLPPHNRLHAALSAPDGRGVPRSPDPEHHHVAHVHGEGVAGAVHDVQRDRAQHRHAPRPRVRITEVEIQILVF